MECLCQIPFRALCRELLISLVVSADHARADHLTRIKETGQARPSCMAYRMAKEGETVFVFLRPKSCTDLREGSRHLPCASSRRLIWINWSRHILLMLIGGLLRINSSFVAAKNDLDGVEVPISCPVLLTQAKASVSRSDFRKNSGWHRELFSLHLAEPSDCGFWLF